MWPSTIQIEFRVSDMSQEYQSIQKCEYLNDNFGWLDPNFYSYFYNEI